MDNPGNNHLSRLAKFFNASLQEFAAFWKSLNDAEKTEYKTAIETWDGQSEFIA